MILFLDSSALVKVYIAEPGSERMRAALARAEAPAVSILAFAEIHATFARRHREGLLLTAELEELHLRFAADWKALIHVPLEETVLALVPALCGSHPLRGADAVHLASSLLFHHEGLEVLFACSDRQLLDAAAGEGLTLFDPVQEDPAEIP